MPIDCPDKIVTEPLIVTGDPVITPKVFVNDISKSTFNGEDDVAVYSALIEPSEYSPSSVTLIDVSVGVGVGVGVSVIVGVTVGVGVGIG